jgi:hypothetical protein
MAQKQNLIDRLSLTGLDIAPSQVWGAIRIVPLIRSRVQQDLRLWQRKYDDDLAVVSLEQSQKDTGLKYFAYVPHGLVLSWSDDGSPVASQGGQILKPDGKQRNIGPASVRLLHRMAKREAPNQLRLLPLHLAMEGFLSLFFSGPDLAWRDYSRYALSHGLGCRWEYVVSGRAIAGLDQALRVFEIHEGQVGVLLFVADALASAFVVPTPEDYRAMHTSLLEDFYGDLLYEYGLYCKTTAPMRTSVDAERITNLQELEIAIAQMRSEWAAFQGFMADGLLRGLAAQRVYTMGAFSLQRFITSLSLDQENHIGEVILRDSGEVEYLKTYRLSAAQTRRVYLLSQLSRYNWNLDATAQAMGQIREDFIYRLEKAGFGYLLNNQVREVAQAVRRKSRKK